MNLRVKSKHIQGEKLPDQESRLSKVTILGSTLAFILTFESLAYLSNMLHFFGNALRGVKSTQEFIHTFASFEDLDWLQFFGLPPFMLFWWIITLSVSGCITYIMFSRLGERFNKLNVGQKGDNHLMTIDEIQSIYPAIPERTRPFSGVGGIPVSHYENEYYIDTNTVNSLILGTSRSGKGEMIVFPMIDILSRAQKQSSMILHDPKGELFSSSKATLEERGYEVQVLNILDPMQSMSYNPLSLIVDAWKQKDYQKAQSLTNTFSHQMFDNPHAGANKWVYDSSKHMVNGIILALIDYCDKHNCLEKVTLYNVGTMISEMNTPMTKESDHTYLDEYFDQLPQGHIAKAQYASAKSAGEKAKGSIFQTVIDGLQIFQMLDIAKMTSENSFPLKSVGFPKFISLVMDKCLYDKPIQIQFLSQKKRKVIFSEEVKPNVQGILELNFDVTLEDGDQLTIDYPDGDSTKHLLYKIQKDIDSKYLILLNHKNNTKNDHLLKDVKIYYTNKPIAVFMITPDYDQSKNTIATTFVDQLYFTLMENASKTRGKKCFRRVHFILDEFGNMPALTDLGHKLSVCLSRNVMFDLFVQSYSQLYDQYSSEVGQVAKENCQNHILIKTNDTKTLEELQNRIGKKTILSKSRTEAVMEIDANPNVSVDSEHLLTIERLGGMLEGEMVVLSPLQRQNKKRERIRPYPIFDTAETRMPYRYEFLSKDFDTSKDINDMVVHSLHKDLDLNQNGINFKSIMDELVANAQNQRDNHKSNILNGAQMDTQNSSNTDQNENEYKNEDVQSNELQSKLQKFNLSSKAYQVIEENLNKSNLSQLQGFLKNEFNNNIEQTREVIDIIKQFNKSKDGDN